MSTPGPGAVQAKYAVRTRAGPLCGINRRVRGRRWWWLRTRRIAIAKGWGEVMSMRYVIPNGALLSADVFVTPGPAGHDRAKCKSSPTRHPTAAHGSLSSPCHSAHFLCSHAHRPLLRRPLQGESSAPPAQICHCCCEIGPGMEVADLSHRSITARTRPGARRVNIGASPLISSRLNLM